MKKIIFAILLTSTFAHAGGSDVGSGRDKKPASPQFFMFKNIIDEGTRMTTELEAKTSERAEYYNQLGLFALGRKSQVSKENCIDIQTVLFSQAISIEGLAKVEMTPEDKALEIDDQVGNLTTLAIQSYFKALKDASDHCSSPKKSLEDVREAKAQVQRAADLLKKVDNGIFNL